MTKVFAIMMLLLTTIHVSAQQADFLEKSKKQKTAAWILLGAGTTVAVSAIILDVNSDWTKSETPYLIAISAGGASMLASIPFFIASGRNKRKALSGAANIEFQQIPSIRGLALTTRSTPVIAFKLNL